MGGLYLLLEEIGGESFAAYKEFGRQIVVAALANVRKTRKTQTQMCMYMCSYMYVCMYVCMSVCVCVCIICTCVLPGQDKMSEIQIEN